MSERWDVGSGGRVILGDKARKLVVQHQEMCWELRRLSAASDRHAVQRVVERYFPGDIYNLLVEEARIEHEKIQASIDERVAAEDYTLWNI